LPRIAADDADLSFVLIRVIREDPRQKFLSVSSASIRGRLLFFGRPEKDLSPRISADDTDKSRLTCVSAVNNHYCEIRLTRENPRKQTAGAKEPRV